MAEILADFRWIGMHGIGRFASQVLRLLPEVKPIPQIGRPMAPLDPVRLGRLLRERRPAAFFSPGFNAPFRCPVPFIFTIHDLIHLYGKSEATLAKRAYYWTFVRPAARRAFAVLTVSEFSKSVICRWADLPPEKVVAVGNGVDEQFAPGGDVHRPPYRYFLYVGNHKPHKNLPRLLQAFRQAAIGPAVRLVLTGHSEPYLGAEIRRLGLGERVVFAGRVEEIRLPEYYRGAVALLIPSLYEGFGLPALEAMACGTPVVAANATSLPEVVGKAAILINPLDVTALATAITRIFHDETLRRDLSTRGIQRAAPFSWQKVAETVQKLLAAAASTGP